MVAHLNVGCHVEGNYGAFLPPECNPDGTQMKRRKRQRLEGTIVESKGEKRWLVRFDNGDEKECPSTGLKLLLDPRYHPRPRPAPSVVGGSAPSVAPAANSAPSVVGDGPNIPSAAANVVGVAPPFALVANATAASVPDIPSASATTSTLEEVAPRDEIDPDDINTTSTLEEVAPPDEIDPDDINMSEQIDEVLEGNNVEDNGFDVVENISSDVYQQKRRECELKKLEMIENSPPVTCKSGSNQLQWKIIPDSIADCPPVEFPKLGVRDMDWRKFYELSSFAKTSLKKESAVKNRPYPYLELFLLLWPGDWKKQLEQLNAAILNEYTKKSKHKHSVRAVKAVTANEFFIFIGIIILSGATGKGGRELFEKESSRLKEGNFRMCPPIDLSPHMAFRRFEDIKAFFPQAFSDIDKSSDDPWYMVSKWIAEFNNNRAKTVAASVIKLLDETMSAWRPRKDKTGGLPNISFILRKPEPLGTEFKSMACSVTGILKMFLIPFFFLLYF